MPGGSRISNLGRLFAAPPAVPPPANRLGTAAFPTWWSRPGNIPRRNFQPWRHNRPTPRTYSTQPSSSPSSSSPMSRAERILSRLPSSMQKYARRLRGAPVSHVVAFLILHEATAVVPLLGLFGLFHYTKVVPLDYMMDHYGEHVAAGVRRFEKYFSRKGWFGFGQEEQQQQQQQQEGQEKEGGPDADAAATDAVLERWTSADAKYKIVVEVALAYAIVKVLLPLRIAASLWATPWFAGLMVRVRTLGRRKN